MASPVTPADFFAVIPTGDDSDCEIIKKVFLRLPVLWWRYHKYKYDATGAITPEFAAEICSSNCNPIPPVNTP